MSRPTTQSLSHTAWSCADDDKNDRILQSDFACSNHDASCPFKTVCSNKLSGIRVALLRIRQLRFHYRNLKICSLCWHWNFIWKLHVNHRLNSCNWGFGKNRWIITFSPQPTGNFGFDYITTYLFLQLITTSKLLKWIC